VELHRTHLVAKLKFLRFQSTRRSTIAPLFLPTKIVAVCLGFLPIWHLRRYGGRGGPITNRAAKLHIILKTTKLLWLKIRFFYLNAADILVTAASQNSK
jgi:hypothetical protein